MILHDLKAHEALRVLRQRHAMTQERAASLCGCDERTWIDIEKGRLLPGLQIATEIEREFGIPVGAWSHVEAA